MSRNNGLDYLLKCRDFINKANEKSIIVNKQGTFKLVKVEKPKEPDIYTLWFDEKSNVSKHDFKYIEQKLKEVD